MSIITKVLVDTTIDWPMKGSRILVENNIGDLEAIHMHILSDWDRGWTYRLHFTLDEFKEFSKKIIDGGRL
mgnify:CR=1 FL=1